MHKDSDNSALVRRICEFILNYSGMGTKDHISLTKSMPIPLIDNQNVVMPIRNIDEALELLKDMLR